MKAISTILLLIVATAASAQLVIKKVKIVSPKNDPYTIEVYMLNDETGKSEWTDVRETNLEFYQGWFALGEINRYCPQYYREYYRFKVGSETMGCYTYTYLELNGGYEKTIIEHTKELRKEFKLDGEYHVYGMRLEEPEIPTP